MTNPSRQVTRITPRRAWYDAGIGELVAAHELLFVFTKRLISVQYKQTLLGLGWAVINPVVTTVVFTFIFGKLAALPSEGLPYPLFVLSALVMWQYFSRAVAAGSNSIVAIGHIVSKVYFPRMILPISSALAGLVDVAVNLVVLVVLMAFYGRFPGLHFVFLPVFLFLLMLLTVGVSLGLSAVNALYHDVGHIVPYLLQVWMYLTPVIYPLDLVPSGWRWLLYLNPLTVLIQGVRWSVFPDAVHLEWIGFAIALPVIAIVLLVGLAIFRSVEPLLADYI